MSNKYYWLIYSVFVIESIFLLIGINIGKITYGIDVATPLSAIGIFAALVIMSILTFIPIINRNKEYVIFKTLLSIILILLSISYIIDDQFAFL